MMKYFAGIVPPDDIYHHIVQIQTKFGDNRLEPHITLRAPVSPTHQENWLQQILDIAKACKPFTIKLPGTGYFGKRVLFISVEAEALHQLYYQLIPALKAFEPQEAKPGPAQYHPHLTLGRNWCGFTADDFTQMQHLANQYLANNHINFEATHVRIYQKPEHQGRWQPYRDVPLGK